MISFTLGVAAARAISTIWRSPIGNELTSRSTSIELPGNTASSAMRASLERLPPAWPKARRLGRFEEKVLGDRQIAAQRQFLMDDAYADGLGVGRVVEIER